MRGAYWPWAYEEFPYMGWIGKLCKEYLPESAKAFYNDTWEVVAKKRRSQNRQFFNFCKTIVSSENERLAKEIDASEALNRYIAAMCYALIISTILVLGVAVWNTLDGNLMTGLFVLAGLYAVAITVILGNLRFSRIKEVETVFAACVKYSRLFGEAKQDAQ